MATKYIVRQQIEMIGKKWLEPVYESEFERPARMAFASFLLDAPLGYFELVKVVTSEECLEFTRAVDPPSERHCHWMTDVDDGSYDTSCGNKHLFVDGTPQDNNYTHCPFCGSLLVCDSGHGE